MRRDFECGSGYKRFAVVTLDFLYVNSKVAQDVIDRLRLVLGASAENSFDVVWDVTVGKNVQLRLGCQLEVSSVLNHPSKLCGFSDADVDQ